MTLQHPSFGAMAPDRVIVFDTTLRDGEQAPGFSMSLDEKLRLAEALAELGVDVIEAGFAIASPGDFASVQAIAARVRGPVIASLARSAPGDILSAAEAVGGAERPRIHTFISISPLHMAHKLRMTPDAVLDAVTGSVALARRHTADVEWSGEDATRADPDFLCRAVEAAIAAGATTINLPDTVGYATPADIARMFADVRARVPGADGVILSAHNHDDLGLGVANTLAALHAGARQVECAVNGIGERAGNAALEEIVMAIRTRADALPYATSIDTTRLLGVSRLLAAITGHAVQPNKAIVGRNAFAHEAGIHQDGILKNALTYEIMTPASVGWSRSSLILGKHSGRAAFRDKLADLGYASLADAAVNAAFARFKALCDVKKTVYDEDIQALLDDAVASDRARIGFVALEARSSSRSGAQAEVELTVDGEAVRGEGVGDGPVDAAFAAVRDAVPHEATLELYSVGAVTAGTDAQARTTVRLEHGGRAVDGQAADPDTVVSAARAYVHALNKLLATRARPADATPYRMTLA